MAWVVDDKAEEIAFGLIERIDASGEVVRAEIGANVGLCAGVVRGLVPGGGYGLVGGRRVVVGLVEMVEGRYREQRFRR